jgi:drug/metabolite transporter (DMT)-like permease
LKKTRNPLLMGILLVIADSFFFSLMSLMVRLSGDLPTMEKAFFRNAIASVVAIITLARSDEKFHIQKGSLPDLFKRAIFGTIGLCCNFWAVDHIGLADANILNKMSPFFAILFSVWILGEVPNAIEVLTLVAAFIGAAFVVKPTMGAAMLPALVGLIGGCSAGVAYTFVRRLGKKGERGPVIVAFFSIFSCLFTLPFMIAGFEPMTARQLICLLLAGIFAAGGQFTVTAAYRFAPAKTISVFDYSQVLFASLWGFLIFDELPDHWSVIGYVIIVGMAVLKWVYTIRADAKPAQT